MRISVVMASYLGEYENCATNRVEKFSRAIQSYIDQTHSDKELIVVSDGCDETKRVVLELMAKYPRKEWATLHIRLMLIKKQDMFSGTVRNHGIGYATGSLICYLDTDDVLRPDHLAKIAAAFYESPQLTWAWYDDFVATSPDLQTRTRENLLQQGRIGTSAIVHRKDVIVRWPSGYGHDWEMVRRLMDAYPARKKIATPGYVVCHIPKVVDF